MKLSISLIAVALAVIAGSAVAAPALYPMERTSDVDIYSRGTQSLYTKQHEEDKHAASQYTEPHHRDYGNVVERAHEAMKSCERAMHLARTAAKSQEMALEELGNLRHKLVELSQTPKTVEYNFIKFYLGRINEKKEEADKVINRLS